MSMQSRYFHLRFCVLIAWVLAGACSVNAQVIALSDLYQHALMHDPLVKAARSAETAAAQRLPIAESTGLPQVVLSADRLTNDLHMGGRQDRYTSSNRTFQIRQPIVRMGLAPSIEQAVRVRDEARAQRENAEQELLIRLSTALFEHMFSLEQSAFVAAFKLTAAQQLRAAELAFAAGSGVRTDIDEARARLDAAHAQELQIRLQVELGRRQLERLSGRNLGQLALLNIDDPWALETELGALPLWLERLEQHPQLRALQARAEGARFEIAKAQAADLPTVDALLRWSKSEGENVFNPGGNYRNNQIGLQLNWPLYQGGGSQATVREAVARLDEAEQRALAIRDELAFRLEGHYRLVQEGRLRIDALRQAVNSANQAVFSSKRSFDAGSRTRLDVFNAEQSLAQAKRDLLQGRLNYVQAQLQLALHSGQEPERALDRVAHWFNKNLPVSTIITSIK
jgi:protease secretion system outer membrane protein